MVNRFGVWFVAVAGVLVAGLVVLSVVSALGTEDDGANHPSCAPMIEAANTILTPYKTTTTTS